MGPGSLLVLAGCSLSPGSALDDPDPRERERYLNQLDAAAVAERYDQVEAVWLTDEDPTVRSRALALLALPRDPRAVPHLQAALASTDTLYQQTAVAGLAHIGDATACAVLVAAYLAWPDPDPVLDTFVTQLRHAAPGTHALLQASRETHPDRVSRILDAPREGPGLSAP